MEPEDREMLTRIDERVERLDRWANGNGQPGAVHRLDVLEASLKEHLQRTRAQPALFSAIAAGVAVLVSVVVAAIGGRVK
jgi:hypothetical protein